VCSSDLVHKFVGRSHGDIKTVSELLKREPALVHASWDWKAGDFETGLKPTVQWYEGVMVG